MAHRGEAPEAHRARVSGARADAVEQAAGEHEADRVRDVERGHDRAVIGLLPGEHLLELRREDREDLPIDVVERRAEEEQGTDAPSITAGRAGGYGRIEARAVARCLRAWAVHQCLRGFVSGASVRHLGAIAESLDTPEAAS